MPTPLSQFQRHQLEVIARVTPHSMAAHLLNTTVMAVAVAGSVPRAQLIFWCVYSYPIALLILYRHVRSRGRVPRNLPRAARRATVYAFLLSLPWSAAAVLYLGSLPHDKELILVALVVGMAASGTILLSALPFAAFAYMSGVLVPSAIKCLVFLNQTGYVLLGVLAISYWWFLAALITKITREIAERNQVEDQQRVLVAELDHRVKNVLATVTAIVTQTQNAGNSVTDFVTALGSRIKSLARTHELLSQSRWSGVSLEEIARREFAPYAADNVEIGGPSVTLKAEAAQAMAMVLHELTTNAAKYGAFSDRNGRVSLRWRLLLNGSDNWAIDWHEIAGPPVGAPSRTSYGTEIVRELIPFELGGTVELAFASDGVRCRMELPAECIRGATPPNNDAKEL
jgi:two-component sensor histidine kinase